ncbi:MAG: SDR family NAD(P)-dependent oxidoreductase [Steroidobacteraceae bacterium]
MQGPNFSLHGKTAVITGASRGLGSCVADALAFAGASVALIGRDEPSLRSVHAAVAEHGGKVMQITADLTDIARIPAIFDHVSQKFARVDILINNAGIEEICASRDVTEPLWDRIVDTNLKAAFFCAQAAARRMTQGGSILNMCSLTSEVGVAGAAPYGASKSGLAGMTRTLAAEWAADGIRVNGIGPGYFRTALTEVFYQDENWRHSTLQKIPLRRFGRLDDIAGAAVFLCSDAAAYITGQILYIDGGILAAL